jgi:hypothetical protein
MRHLLRACSLQLRDVGVGPDDLRAVAAVFPFDAFARIAGLMQLSQ